MADLYPELKTIPLAKEAETKAEGFPELKNDLILRAAKGEPVEKVPIWCHRQAGRYLPEYHVVRNTADFFTICRTPHLACEITLQPIRRFPLDAAIIFSDILVIPQALGMEVKMVKGKGPVIPKPLVEPDDLKNLKEAKSVDLTKALGYVFEALTLTRHRLEGKVPLIGFSGAPWTLMAYMVQGEGAKSYYKAKAWLYRYPKASHKLLQEITDLVVRYLVGQVQAGAQMLEVFDSWAGDLTQSAFAEFSLPYLLQIASKVKNQLRVKDISPVPMTLFARGADWALEELSASEYDVLSLNWTVNPKEARARVQGKVGLQGNLEPSILFASEEDIRREVRQMVQAYGPQRYIANLGHGMLPSMKPEALATFVDEVHKVSEALVEDEKTAVGTVCTSKCVIS
mmetsp:Transcript_21872/g.32593  ORF Transcript_21872/g.32593 Transcript_21872/m.32593 type:complete len:399 (+) Transcript_21872:21-1217(+)